MRRLGLFQMAKSRSHHELAFWANHGHLRRNGGSAVQRAHEQRGVLTEKPPKEAMLSVAFLTAADQGNTIIT
jgi:hypothetical protein